MGKILGRSTGCITCLARHIKCDEGQPTCRNCHRADLTCQGYRGLPVTFDPHVQIINQVHDTQAPTPRLEESEPDNGLLIHSHSPTSLADVSSHNAAHSNLNGYSRLRPDEKRVGENVQDSEEKVTAVAGPSAKRAILNNFGSSGAEMIVVEPNLSYARNGIDDSNLRLGEIATGNVAREEAKNIATTSEQSTKLDDTDLSLPKTPEGELLEELSTQGDQLVRQYTPKEVERWNIRTLLSTLGLEERPLEEGKTRVRWRCGCGRNMYDDFIELRPGAAAEFEKWLNDSMRNHAVSGPSNSSQFAHLRSTASPGAVNSGHQQTAESDITLQRLGSRIDTLSGSGGNAAVALDVHLEKCWLLVCGKPKTGPDSLLTQLDLSSTLSDKDLFDDMREFYSNLRRKWTLRSFLRGVKTIRFVQFELHKMDRVDIRKVPDMPPETRRDEYLYEPCDLIPPVGEEFMTHWFQHPEEAWELLYAYSLFPKKRKDNLKINLIHGPRVGWGIQIVEGWLGSRIWLLSLSLFLCGSLTFGICWTVLKHDIQGAFGISAYVIALLTLVVGAAQANIG